MSRVILWAVATLVALGLVIQVIPYGRDHTNPPVRREPRWDSAETRALAVRACFDCHSNDTRWPWYSNVAPVSWLMAHDVGEGRHDLDYSEWDRAQKEARDQAKKVRTRDMPPWYYSVVHPLSRLSDAEREALARGLEATLRADPPPGRPVPTR